jgi:hypothetical protein
LFIYNLSEELSPFLSVFFQLSIDNGNIPVDWKQANVVPIFKKGDKHSAVTMNQSLVGNFIKGF